MDYLGIRTELPYRFGKVYSIFLIGTGAIFILLSLFSLVQNDAPSLLVAGSGIFNLIIDIGIYNKTRWGFNHALHLRLACNLLNLR